MRSFADQQSDDGPRPPQNTMATMTSKKAGDNPSREAAAASTTTNNNNNSNNKTTTTKFEETIWDERLDYLRQHRLSPAAEVVLAWVVAMMCLAYYAYSYLSLCFFDSATKSQDFFPLVTQAAGQTETRSVTELYQIMGQRLHVKDVSAMTDEQLVRQVRADVELRRVVSALFQQQPQVSTVVPPHQMERFRQLWPRFLALPDLPSSSLSNDEPGIALILPAYREDGNRMVRTLQTAIDHCAAATRVQIIIVHAGHCTHMEAVHAFLNQQQRNTMIHASSCLVDYTDGGGRGPTLHAGTRHVKDDDNIQLLTFLHSDTLLPRHWDATVRRAWFGRTAIKRQQQGKQLQAAAFLFGHDKSQAGLNGGPYPWGIEAVQVLGNVRAYVASLPYGDHVLCMPVAYYRHVGGFPAQPIMEDYQLMDYWRQRAAAAVTTEYMTILPSMIRTGVRRWQAHGVVYVTLVNALIVFRYQRGWTPQDVYEYYYQRPQKKTSDDRKMD